MAAMLRLFDAQFLQVNTCYQYDFNRPIESNEPVDWLGLAPEGRNLSQKKNFQHDKYRLLRNNKYVTLSHQHMFFLIYD